MGFGKHTFFIETYGCQMNKAESEALTLQLEAAGWKASEVPEDAGLVILHTCSVRKTAEERILGRIGYYRHLKKKRPFKLAVIGCMTQRSKGEDFANNEEIDVLIGNFQKHRLSQILDELDHTEKRFVLTETGDFSFDSRYSLTGFKAFVPIMHGCNNYCTYCIVPYVRGPEVSRNPDHILEEVEALDCRGVREITLLGQNVNSYAYPTDRGTLDFPRLLRMIAGKVRGIRWIRFLTSHPKDLSPELIEVLAECPVCCHHIHLPVQHGSNRILKLMERGYSREGYLQRISTLKNRISDIAISTDILIGFPGEEEKDVELTLELMKEVGFSDAYTYRYNPREGTRAFEMGDTVPEEVKLERLSRIIDIQRKLARQKRREHLGEKTLVLAESLSKKNPLEILGRTERDEMVVFPGEPYKIGLMSHVKLVSLNGITFRGEEVL